MARLPREDSRTAIPQLEKMIRTEIPKAIYPVGIVIQFDVDIDPNKLWEGMKWVKIAEGRSLMGAGAIKNTYSIRGTQTTFETEYELGEDVDASLPNITGVGHYADNNNGFAGALYNVQNGNFIGDGSASGTLLGLDASRHNSIYSNDTNVVQPNAHIVNFWKRIA